ncbi:MAG: nucleotide exchange factor GrpE [Candidatus Pacebacteria bacterium CG10_big_fil_rev_8_21_14_0_10_36_11]|nr:nucleotide exchange factor GrpE [Candidatus Pacearchaeota archaeon]OIP73767.1 MAG: nucleotide exchange factor GrpE [Candidatus Pacebacteria bacterium CG2_30_36_39]PIR64648.1 MAG: nucleotide exchange factor GrpE [Candidatus Pacebacteria bacterium CG10_big_fil_rev_8_21_14_0_10_36_11]PJC42901.1 MAG: nucleotide exchange factor GrpE [Candidatus Pacebacteria bacterium CG_4_9_14_0_2_um_filter_36_8]
MKKTKISNNTDHVVADQSEELVVAIAKVAELEEKLSQELEKEKRSLADYQNLMRRTQEERLRSIKMANRDLIESLLQPFEHLQLAAQQLQDQGLTMVTEQLKKVLADFGLEEIEVLNKEFDVETMEVIEKQQNGKKVVQVSQKGYRLNGLVIQHAKVVLD